MIKIKKDIFDALFYNALLTIAFFVIAQIGNSIFRLLATTLMLGITLLRYIALKNELFLKNFIIFFLFDFFIFSMSYRYGIGKDAINYLYLIDFLLIIFLIKLLVTNNVKFINDKFVILYLILVFVGIITGILNSVSFVNCLIAGYIYIRCLPIYIVVTNPATSFCRQDLICFCIINIIPMPLLMLQYNNGGQDDMAGLFGFGGQPAFGLLAVIFITYFLYEYFQQNIKFRTAGIACLIFFLWTAVSESKMVMVYGFCVIALFVVFFKKNKKKKLQISIKKLTMLLLIPIMLVIGLRVMLWLYPMWNVMFDMGIQRFLETSLIENRISYYSIGKLETIPFIFFSILETIITKISGIGIGNGQPGLMSRYVIFAMNNNRSLDNIWEVLTTPFYETYGLNLGYHRSGIGILLLECGLIGCILYLLIMVIIIKRCFILMRKNNNCIGWIGLSFIIFWLIYSFFYNTLFDLRYQVIFFFICGIISKTLSENN